MKKPSFIFFSVLGLSLIFLIVFHLFTTECFQTSYLGRSNKNFPVANNNQIPITVNIDHSDLVLNYSQKIHPPLRCVPFQTIQGKIPICVHDNPKEYITNEILQTGYWEKPQSISLQKLLISNPESGVVDIGANLGMYSLLAANLQRPVLSVEAMDINIGKYHQSIVINHFENLITLVTKPLSDKYETLRLTAGVTNLGMSRLVNSSQNMKGLDEKRYNTKDKRTALLDDLIKLYPRKQAIMIIDVEGNEGKVIRGGQKFFDRINISHVFMEWNLLTDKDRQFLVEFFTQRNYKPFSSLGFSKELVITQNARWPKNIFWKKIGGHSQMEVV